MDKMIVVRSHFLNDIRGASSVEYAGLVALVGLGAMAGMQALGGSITSSMTNLGGQVEQIGGGAQPGAAP